MSDFNQRMDIIFIFTMHFFIYIISVALLFSDFKSFAGIALLYYLFSIAIFISIIAKGKEKHPGKIFWKVILVFDFLVFFIALPLLPTMVLLSGLAWA
jgi:hypothetical protein